LNKIELLLAEKRGARSKPSGQGANSNIFFLLLLFPSVVVRFRNTQTHHSTGQEKIGMFFFFFFKQVSSF
jgi:hypothetical protein